MGRALYDINHRKILFDPPLGAAVSNLFGTRDWFRGREFFHRQGVGDGSGCNASYAEQQMNLPLLAHRSPPAVQPGS